VKLKCGGDVDLYHARNALARDHVKTQGFVAAGLSDLIRRFWREAQGKGESEAFGTKRS